MGAVFQGILRAFMTIAPGYFANDVMSFFGNVFNVQPREEDKKYPGWFVIAVLVGIAALTVFVMRNFFKGKK